MEPGEPFKLTGLVTSEDVAFRALLMSAVIFHPERV